MSTEPGTVPVGPGSFLDGLGAGTRLWRAAWGRWTVALLLVGLALGSAVLGLVVLFPEWAEEDSLTPSRDHLAAETLLGLGVSLATAAILSVALTQVRGGRVELTALLWPLRRPAVWFLCVVHAVVVTVLDAFTYIGGSLVSLLSTYVLIGAIEGSPVGRAIVLGWATMRSLFLSRLGFLILCGLIAGAGVLACGVGALVTVPIAAVAVAWSHPGARDADVDAAAAPSSG